MSEHLIATEENQKLRGGYYTPQAIADFLARWSVRSSEETVLEPSCGNGNLLLAAAKRLKTLGTLSDAIKQQIQGIELFESEVRNARQRLEEIGVDGSDAVRHDDFFQFAEENDGIFAQLFDVVIGNPPFLRYHSFPDMQRERAFGLMRRAGLNPTKLTNAWVAFLVIAAQRLKPKGRLAMVIPAELLQVKYAEETRCFLARHFSAITIITFRRLVFEGIQQEVVLLLAEKSSEIESGIDVVELDSADDLARHDVVLRERSHLKTIDHAEEKWIKYYLSQREIDLLRTALTHPNLSRLKEWAEVDVGVVTGENRFFAVNETTAQEKGLALFTVPLVGRTVQLPGLMITASEWEAQKKNDVRCHLLNLPPVPLDQLPASVATYVQEGEAAGYHSGYKCRIRKPWYQVPSLWSPDAFLFRQIHGYPKMVLNQAEAISTDTIHRVRFHQQERGLVVCAAFLNSLTFAFSEVTGRSYGGGVLELEPNEAERLPIPLPEKFAPDFALLDNLERDRKIADILDQHDARLLQEFLGFDQGDTRAFRQVWEKLRDRRIGRKVRAKVEIGE